MADSCKYDSDIAVELVRAFFSSNFSSFFVMSDSDRVNVGAGSSSGVVRLKDLETTVDALVAKASESQGTTGMCQNVYVLFAFSPKRLG